MATVVHVFEEDCSHCQDGHIDNWFGRPNEKATRRGIESVCQCGAQRHPLAGDVTAVWHLRKWEPPYPEEAR